jgi:hypothetical protein
MYFVKPFDQVAEVQMLHLSVFSLYNLTTGHCDSLWTSPAIEVVGVDHRPDAGGGSCSSFSLISGRSIEVAWKFVRGVSLPLESNWLMLGAGVFSGAAVSASKKAPGASSWILASPSIGTGRDRKERSPCAILGAGVLVGGPGTPGDDDTMLLAVFDLLRMVRPVGGDPKVGVAMINESR